MRARWKQHLRDLFFISLALLILYQQVWVAREAQPLLVSLAVFLLASAPALRGDKKEGYGALSKMVMRLMGVDIPD